MWEAVISASPKVDRRWLMILTYSSKYLKDDLNSWGFSVLCWLEKCPGQPASHLNWGTMHAGERGIDTLKDWKSVCSDGNFWNSVLVLGVPLLSSSATSSFSFLLSISPHRLPGCRSFCTFSGSKYISCKNWKIFNGLLTLWIHWQCKSVSGGFKVQDLHVPTFFTASGI